MASGSAMLPKRLEGKVALITGGASGIGACTAKLFAAHGAKVVVADIQDDLGHALCNDVIGSTAASFVHCDVTVESDVKNAVDFAVSRYGKLDIMHNNAGISGERSSRSILENTKEEFERVLQVNLVGPFLGTKHAARAMVPTGGGSIVMTASVSGVIGGTATHSYTSSKHGVVGLAKNAAVELGRYGIRVNCVSPDLVATALTERIYDFDEEGVAPSVYSNMKGRCCKVEDVAAAVLYLASDEAKYVNGLNLVVDGGLTIMNPGLCAFEDFSKWKN